MTTFLLVAKYIFSGILIFLGAIIFAKSISKIVDNKIKKDEKND